MRQSAMEKLRAPGHAVGEDADAAAALVTGGIASDRQRPTVTARAPHHDSDMTMSQRLYSARRVPSR